MSIGSKIKGFMWTLGVVAVVGGAGLYFLGSPNGKYEETDEILVGALWEPINRDNPLRYRIRVGGVPYDGGEVRQSPMERTFKVRHSDAVVFEIQQVKGGLLTCFITRDGAAVVPQPRGSVAGAATAICVG